MRREAALLMAKNGTYGLKFTKLVCDLVGYDAVDQSDYDYNHLLRFVRELERDGYVETEKRGDPAKGPRRPLWIFPTRELFAVVADTVLDTASRSTCPQRSTGGGGEDSEAKANAEARLRRRQTIDTAVSWGGLIGSFGAKKLGYERTADADRATYAVVSEAAKATNRLTGAFERAAAGGYDRGAVVSATTTPWRYANVMEAAAELTRDERNLRKMIARRLENGMPEYIAAPEPTKRGVPHVHIALFGVDVEGDEFPSNHALHDYWWENAERGFEIDVEAIAVDGSGGRWCWEGDGPEDADGCPPAAYVAEGARAVEAGARATADDVLAVADAYRDRGSERIAVTEEIGVDVDTSTAVDPSEIRVASWYWALGREMRPATIGSEGIRP